MPEQAARIAAIFRAAGQRTLPLANSLNAVGLEAWTPRQTLRAVPGSKPGLNGRRPTMDVDAPILPTFVFAPSRHLIALAATQSDQAGPHPAFSIFDHGGRAPLIANRDIAGLQDAERVAAKLIEDLRAADTLEEQRKIRAAAMNTELERQIALRRETHHFEQGQIVSIGEVPAFAGMSLSVEGGDGHSAAMVLGSMRMKIHSWRPSPNSVLPSRS